MYFECVSNLKVLGVMCMKNRFEKTALGGRVPNLTILAGPKPKNFLSHPTMVADIFKKNYVPL